MASAFPDDGRKRHSTALMVVLDIFPQIMTDMICNSFPPNTVLELIENDSIFETNLHSREKKMISDIRSKGYNSLDISLFYKIIRYLKLLRPPKQGWGKKPESGDINKGDDVERMKNLRNVVIHQPPGGLSESEIDDFFRQSIEIAKRMDDRIGRPQNGFESKVEEIRSYTITHENYIKLLENCVEHQARLQEIAGAPSFDLFYGKDIKIEVDAQIDHPGSGGRTLACSLYLRDPDFDVNSVIQMIDVIQEYLRRGNFAVSLVDAASGSLILHVTIHDTCFMTKEILHKTVHTFLHAFFIGAAIPFKLEHIYTVVLGESEYLVLDNEKKNDLDYLRENTSPYLKLNVNVNDSAFQNEFTLYREVNSFVAGMYNAVDRQNVPSNGSSREVLMIVDSERVINYTNTFEAIRESQFRSKEKSMMASSAKLICTTCSESGISKAAVTWCIECEVFFCGECEKTHKWSRVYKNHNTIASQDYHELPKFMQEISSKCRNHKRTIELYCPFHCCPCCVQCVTDKHQKCFDMKPFSDFIKDVKVSESVLIYEQDLKDVNENLVKAINDLKTRISTINTQKTEAFEQIRYTRSSIDDYLNKIEQKILDDLDSKHSELKLNMASLVKQLEQRLSKIEQIQSEYTKMTQYASNLQTYVALKGIANTTSEAATYIAGLKESGDLFSEKNLKVNISSGIQSIEKDVNSFGDITINTTKPKISMFKRLTIPKNMKFLNIITCLVLSDGKVIILDYNEKQLLLFSNDGKFMRNVVTFRDFPSDACLVEKNTVAVILESANQTALVDVEKNIVVQIIELSHYSYGVASDGKNLIIISDGRNLDMSSRIIKVNLYDMSQIILGEVKELNYVALFQGNIYGTNSSENTVCCYKSTGEPVWRFQHQQIAKPGGLSLDNNGFVYLASQKNNSIVVVSPDGKTCKTILSEADGIISPWAIDINRETGMMVVSSYMSGEFYEYDTAFVYKI